MKSFFSRFLPLLAAALLLSQHHAKSQVPYNSGDLLIGFWASAGTGSTKDYVIDVGPVTNYEGLAAGQHITLLSSTSSMIGLSGSDLTATFGANWIKDGTNGTGTTLNWAAVSEPVAGDPSNTLYATIGESGANQGTSQGIDYIGNPQGSRPQQNPANDIGSIGFQFANNDTPTTNSANATVQTDSEDSSFESFMSTVPANNGVALQYFNGGIGGTFNDSGTTAGDMPLDLYRIPSTSSTSSYIATITIDSSGDITFANDMTAAVPEPVTCGLVYWGVGALFLIGRHRRKAHLRV